MGLRVDSPILRFSLISNKALFKLSSLSLKIESGGVTHDPITTTSSVSGFSHAFHKWKQKQSGTIIHLIPEASFAFLSGTRYGRLSSENESKCLLKYTGPAFTALSPFVGNGGPRLAHGAGWPCSRRRCPGYTYGILPMMGRECFTGYSGIGEKFPVIWTRGSAVLGSRYLRSWATKAVSAASRANEAVHYSKWAGFS
ncbi:hypothetical protein CRG98_038143 [Punica granatum]|uniref:Uncharacterized protein n=1 Tax=Punica granatum TaxID=22663 RepID=A0A2I0IBU6_PUNGR|nr:hypothetical protein CRG98_038143 [Punica granatum]